MITKEQLLAVAQGEVAQLPTLQELASLPDHQRLCYLTYMIDNADPETLPLEIKQFLRLFKSDLLLIRQETNNNTHLIGVYENIDQYFPVE